MNVERTVEPRSADEIRIWLIARIAEHLRQGAAPIDIHAKFTALGLPSIEAASLSGDLSRWLGRRISPLVLWDYPTIDHLARYLAGEPVEPVKMDAPRRD